jgi:hypothetical protein
MREITEVHLMEVSLVDKPANPHCRVIAIDGVALEAEE